MITKFSLSVCLVLFMNLTSSSSDNLIINDLQEEKITIAELVANPSNYEGKFVIISGECTKINANIMGLNWIHLIDGTKDDFDLVITTKESVRKGAKITIRAKVALNKDIGAGYVYDILLEEGTVFK